MAELVKPQTYLVGYTDVNRRGLNQYLLDSDQNEFAASYVSAVADGVDPAEALCSFYAKLCYASLVTGKNDNISSVRTIRSNLIATLESGHGSVFEHVSLNFVTTNCSRVFTHELVRHRVGTAFSQTSGRYVRTDTIRLVLDPILEPLRPEILGKLAADEAFYLMAKAKLGLASAEDAVAMLAISEKILPNLKEAGYEIDRLHDEWVVKAPVFSFDYKKKLTSALRRLLPNGQANEIGWSINVRALRHTIMLRTNRHAEWEIRVVFEQVYKLAKEKWPLLFFDAQEEIVDGIVEVTGMKTQPYE